MKKIGKLNQTKFLNACKKGLFEEIEYIFDKQYLSIDKDGNIFHIKNAKNNNDAKSDLHFALLDLRSLYKFHDIA